MHAHGAEYRRYWRQMTAAQQKRTRDVLMRSSALIVLGNVWREFFVVAGVPAERVVVLPNPVILPESVPDRRGKSPVKFIYLGIIDHRKGAFDLVDAIQALPADSRTSFHFTFAGNGEVDRLRGQVANCGLGDVIEVRDWIDARQRDQLLADADAFVLPSRNEGMPMAMLEAMAWALPVICTPVGSIPELVTDGDNGLLVAPGDVSAISAAIMRLARDETERTAMGWAARRSVEPLAAEKYMNRLVALYNFVLAQPSR
jgi:glycosyltransferase involved in cell wall biosynthesis